MRVTNSQSIRWLAWAGSCLSCRRGRRSQFCEATECGGRSLYRTCCWLRLILLKSRPSHSSSWSLKSGSPGGQNPQRLLRRRKASTRWMSVAVTNSLHAVDAYVKMDITTARNTSCSPASDNPWYLRTRRAYSVFALSLTTLWMWSDAGWQVVAVGERRRHVKAP